MKNKGILLGIIIIAFLCIDLHAQQIQNNIYVNDTKVYQEGDSIIIEMTIDGSKAKLASNEVLLLTPVIKADNNIKELHPIIIKGNIRYKADKRTQFFQNNRMKNDIEPLIINEVSFNVEQGGEDWNGLEKLVSVSDLSDKNRILDILSSSALEDVKEQRLKALSTTYRILLEEYFPKLRRVDYRLNYVVRAFSVEEGKVIVKTNPGQMSLNEMFLVANSYEKGSKEFKDVFDIAVRIFPKDMVANINAAAIALEDGNIQAAHRYLDNYRDVSTSWNNLGVLYTLEGNLDKAKEFFNKAQNIGVIEATENLKKIALLEDYNTKIKE